MKCKHCDSERVNKCGTEKRDYGYLQRYKCLDCKKSTYQPVKIEGWDKVKAITEEARKGNIPEIGLNENLQGLEVTGVTYLKKDENNILHWVKTKAKSSSQDMLGSVIERLIDRVPERNEISAPTRFLDESLLTQYTITDLHVGMYSWAQETGADWDLKICYRTITEAMNIAIANSTESKVGLFLQLGDFFHYDGHNAITPTSGNLLDADGRFQHMLDVGEDIIFESIDKLLTKHDLLKVIIAQGNHDIATSDTLRSIVRRYYRQNPRVEVIGGPNPFYAYEHGLAMVGAHHGHLKKRVQLPAHFAQFFSEMWGRCKFRYLHSGHLHCQHEEEKGGALTIQHATMAAPDAYAAHKFDKTMRSINTITYHNKYGMIQRNTIPLEMI